MDPQINRSKEALGHLYTSLSGRNFVTIPAEDVEKKLLTTPGPACDVRGECGQALVRTFNADFGASAIVWKPTSKNAPSSVAVFLFAARGKRFEGRADVRNDDLRSAIDEATAKAVHAKRIEMPVTPARVTEQPVQPAANSAPQLSTQEAPSKPKHNLVGPLILGGAGIAALIWSGASLINASSCDVKSPTGECLQGNQLNTAPFIAVTAVGVGAIAGAIVWYVLSGKEPKQNQTTALNLTPTTASLRVKF